MNKYSLGQDSFRITRFSPANIHSTTAPYSSHEDEQFALPFADSIDVAKDNNKSGASLRSSLFRDVTQCRLVVTDVSGQPIDPMYKGRMPDP